MNVFIANFGRGNHLWPSCLSRDSIAVFDDADTHPFWLNRDPAGYIAYCIANKKTPQGISPTKPVASRWYNLIDVVCETAHDLWLHRDKDELWWTVSKEGKAEIVRQTDALGAAICVFNKPSDPWSNMSRRGTRLLWQALHPRAKSFLFTEGTLQRLATENARYVHALIDGSPLDAWHTRPDWRSKLDKAGHGAATMFSPEQRSAVRMARTAMDTAAAARGQDVVHATKVKDMHFAQQDLEAYILALLGNRCVNPTWPARAEPPKLGRCESPTRAASVRR